MCSGTLYLGSAFALVLMLSCDVPQYCRGREICRNIVSPQSGSFPRKRAGLGNQNVRFCYVIGQIGAKKLCSFVRCPSLQTEFATGTFRNYVPLY